MRSAALLLYAALGAFAAPGLKHFARQNNASADACASKKVLIGAPGMIATADFNGTGFEMGPSNRIAGTASSWLLFKEPNLVYAVDEYSNSTRLFNFDSETNNLTLVQDAIGSSGVVFLEFNKDKTRMVGAAYGQGQIDVWDVSAPNGTMKLLKQLPVNGTLGSNATSQATPHPHEALLDPTGRFFVVPDLGTDSLLVIDCLSDSFNIVSRVSVSPPGNGPRHGSFYPLGAEKATHFFLVSETLNLITVFELVYTCSSIEFKNTQLISTFGIPPADPSKAAAGELIVSRDNKHLYVSNRLTGNDTDNISHFSIDVAAKPNVLAFVDEVSSGGELPRMFSLAADDGILFSTNQQGTLGLLAFQRDNVTGSLTETPVASLPNSLFGEVGYGPMFVMEI